MPDPAPASPPTRPPAPRDRGAMSQPWMWLIVGIPAATVVAGLATLYIAVQHADPVLGDGHVRSGMAVLAPRAGTGEAAVGGAVVNGTVVDGAVRNGAVGNGAVVNGAVGTGAVVDGAAGNRAVRGSAPAGDARTTGAGR